MCTVTYLPLADEQFLFTSNRDESPRRAASNIQRSYTHGDTLLYPQDSHAKGTWIAISNARQLVCILNGAFTKHKHRPPYRLSRGIMALQYFAYRDTDHFLQEFQFTGMEPFTMIIYDRGTLYDLRWDEHQTNLQQLDTQRSHLWASPTLYSPGLQAERKEWFAEWQEQQSEFTSENITHFHRTGGKGDPETDLVMNRSNVVQTTSITHVAASSGAIKMQYHNLLHGQTEAQELRVTGR